MVNLIQMKKVLFILSLACLVSIAACEKEKKPKDCQIDDPNAENYCGDNPQI